VFAFEYKKLSKNFYLFCSGFLEFILSLFRSAPSFVFEFTTMKELRVLTWNIWFDRSTMEQRLPRLLDTIEAQNPDVVAMQVPQTHHPIHCSLLIARLLSPLTTHHSPLTTHHSPLTTHHSPLTTHHSPLTRHSLLTTHYSLLTTHYSTHHFTKYACNIIQNQ
jgi:hypothetical protein